MSIKRLVPLNTVSLPSNPPTAIAGDIYYNSGLSKLLYFNGTDWIELAGSANSLVYAKSIYQDVRNQSGATISIGTPVYISGAIGASGKILISPASNASEATSSKTMAITTSAISNNSNGQIISEGLLEGIDTTGASDGDPVWLGVNGAKIYGLANKPAAPAHLVFLGIVVNGGSANAGSIFVKIQNGFELQEIHNVELSSLINGNILAYDSTTSTWKNTNTLQSTASTIPLVIKGSASQTANLQEWQNSSGTMLASITDTGFSTAILKVPYIYTYAIQGWNGAGGSIEFANATPITIKPQSASVVNLVIKGAASQTANLQEWQTSTGSILGKLDKDGKLTTIDIESGALNATWRVYSTAGAPTVVPITAKGAASQTANLQEWQDSSGTVLAKVQSNGVIDTSQYLNMSTSGNAGIAVGGNYRIRMTGGNTRVQSSSGIVTTLTVEGAASQTANLQEWQDSAGAVKTGITSSGQLYTTQRMTIGLSDISSLGELVVSTADAARIGVVVQGVTSQTANLQEWQNSSGTVNAFMTVGGFLGTNSDIRGLTGGIFGGITKLSSAGLTVYATAAGNPGAIIRGTTSQTAKLQEWQNSAGTVVASTSVEGNGYFQANLNAASIGAGNNIGGASLTASPWSAATVVSIIRGYTSQSSDLTQWQNSTGTVLTKITSDGSINTSGASGIYSTYGFSSAGGLSIGNGVTSIYVHSTYGMGIQSASGNVTDPTLVIKLGSVNQTGSLQEWHSSTGTILANVSSAGRINAPQFGSTQSGKTYVNTGTSADSNSWTFVTNSASNKGIVVVGAASQSANLQEWQNISGTVLAKVDASGNSTAASFVKTSGTSSEFLKADGSVDSSTYLTTGTASSTYLPLTGGTVSSDLTVTGNFTVNGTTTNLNSTNLVVEDKNIIIADVTTPTDTTADGAGITIKGATDKTLNWVQSTGSFTSSDPFIINTTSTTRSNLIVKAIASQTSNLTEWHNSVGGVVAKIDSNAIFNSLNSGSGADSYSSIIIGGRWIRNEQRANLTRFGVNTGEWHLASNPDNSAIAITDSQVGVFATSTTLPLLTVKGMASQTADLQQWQDSTGAVLAEIMSNGSLFINSTGTSNDPITIQRASATRFKVDPYGNVFAGALTAGSVVTSIAGTTAGIYPSSASTNGLIIRGAASQTADLQQWQNSSGAVLSAIDASGSFTSVSQPIQVAGSTYGFSRVVTADLGATSYWKIATLPSTTLSTYDQINIEAMLGTWSSTGKTKYEIMMGNRETFAYKYTKFGDGLTQARIQAYTEANGSVSVYAYSENGFTTFAYNITLSTTGSNGATIYKNPAASTTEPTGTKSFDTGEPTTYIPLMNMTNAGLLSTKNAAFTSTSTSAVTLTVQSAASQTANIQEWKNNAGTTAYLNTNLQYYNPGRISVLDSSFSAILSIFSGNPAATVSIFRGAASQTADLAQWQNSAGTTYLNVTNAGAMLSNGGVTIASNPTINAYGAAMKIASGVNSYPMLIIQGATSQTADLQQWQDSAASVIARITPAGGITVSSNITQSSSGRTFIGGAADYGAFLNVGIPTASRQGIVVRANASQTANLEEWQNNAGTVLAKVDASGNFSAISKSFDIPHPTKENMRLRYASLEGNEHGVYVRGITKDKVIELPDYWLKLVDKNSITVHLTPIGKPSRIYVKKIEGNKVYLGGRLKEAAYIIHAERKDIDKLTVEY